MINTIPGNANKAFLLFFFSPSLQLRTNRNVIERSWLKSEGLDGEKRSELKPHPVPTQRNIKLLISYVIWKTSPQNSCHTHSSGSANKATIVPVSAQEVGKIFANLSSRNEQQQESPSPVINTNFQLLRGLFEITFTWPLLWMLRVTYFGNKPL